ncbi:MAG: hypothetical protein KDA86_14860 [Planctomycetaceae bacterium]|nr:hypothetical protein [Planctomycetaceae bacterium]MCA9108714.1 hypothetical protein [Planctomycetaceae bacterium]
MSEIENSTANSSPNQFQEMADEQQLSLASELWMFIIENKAWWMVPIVVVLALIGILIALSATGATPFIYTIF